MSIRILLRTLGTLGRGLVSGLPEPEADRDPIALFEEWFAEAAKSTIVLPEAMSLATASLDARPSVRMVLLKSVDEGGFTFFTNYGSRKACELDENPHAAATFHWDVLQRQIRIEGTVQRISREESDAYFQSRARASQIGAWASRQSSRLGDSQDLKADFNAMKAKFGSGKIPLPPFWGGYRIVPVRIEFWQGRASRMHARLRFNRTQEGWDAERLYP